MSPPKPKPVTLQDVATQAGVSLATASRVLNGSNRRVSDRLRDRVVGAAERLGYRPNLSAQATATGRTNMIGLLVHEIADPHFTAIATGVIRAAEAKGLLVTIASTDGNPAREAEHIAAFRGQRARAVVVAGSLDESNVGHERLASEIAAFEQGGGRLALISHRGLPVDTVVFENRAGARALAHALCEAGYERFAVLGGPPTSSHARARLAGFREGLAAAGVPLPVDAVVHSTYSREGGWQAMRELMDRSLAKPPVCVFGVNDMIALGALNALRERDLRVPDDVALAGFGDVSALVDVRPSVTTVRVPLTEAGRLSVELVLSDKPETPRTRRLRSQVLIRESTPTLVS